MFPVTIGMSCGDLCSRGALETLPTSTQGREQGLKTRLVFIFETTEFFMGMDRVCISRPGTGPRGKSVKLRPRL